MSFFDDIVGDLNVTFDLCNDSKDEKVAVSKLLAFIMERFFAEVHASAPPESLDSLKETVKDVKRLLDPLDVNCKVDKSSWIVAWQSHLCSNNNNMSATRFSPGKTGGGDDIETSLESAYIPGVLDQSRDSYSFSPGESDDAYGLLETHLNELREKNQLLSNDVRDLQERLEISESALSEELIKTEDLSTAKERNEKTILSLNKSVASHREHIKDLESSLRTSELEKVSLCRDNMCKAEEVKLLKVRGEEIKIELNTVFKENQQYKTENDKLFKELHQNIESQVQELMENQREEINCLKHDFRNEKKLLEEEIRNLREILDSNSIASEGTDLRYLFQENVSCSTEMEQSCASSEHFASEPWENISRIINIQSHDLPWVPERISSVVSHNYSWRGNSLCEELKDEHMKEILAVVRKKSSSKLSQTDDEQIFYGNGGFYTSRYWCCCWIKILILFGTVACLMVFSAWAATVALDVAVNSSPHLSIRSFHSAAPDWMYAIIRPFVRVAPGNFPRPV